MTGVPLPLVLLGIILFSLLGAIAVTVHTLLTGPRARIRKRVALLARNQVETALAPTGAHRKSIQIRLKELEAKRQKKRGYRLREQLARAGLSTDPRRFIAASFVCGAVGAGAAFLFALPPVTVVAVAVTSGLGLPRFTLKILVKRRLQAFTKHFAEAIDIIVRGVRSGLPVGECFTVIAKDAPDPVGAEFRLIVEGQRLGLSTEEVLERATDRVPTPELRYFAIVLAIQQSTGGNLAETLAKLSDVLRARKRMRDKVSAFSSEAKTSAGIIGSLPILVAAAMFLVAPDYVSILFQTPSGHLMLASGVSSMVSGALVMRKMIAFDI